MIKKILHAMSLSGGLLKVTGVVTSYKKERERPIKKLKFMI